MDRGSARLPEKTLPVVCVLGPTAAGKTALALELLQRFPMEIVSVDSALVYRGMDIGTAKPDSAVLKVAPHALIDLVDPWQSYSVSRFLIDARREILRISEGRKIPLLVGGTMLYFHSLWHGLTDLPEASPAVRADIEKAAAEFGWEALHDKLRAIDPQSARRIHPNDPQRLTRALEVHALSGSTLTELVRQRGRGQPEDYDFLRLGLYPNDRAQLHQLIEQRFDQMLAAGFEAEVARLMADERNDPEQASMRCVGYRQMWRWLAGEGSGDEMREQAVAATRQLAKRQFTWMRRMDDLHLTDPFERPGLAPELFDTLEHWCAHHLEG